MVRLLLSSRRLQLATLAMQSGVLSPPFDIADQRKNLLSSARQLFNLVVRLGSNGYLKYFDICDIGLSPRLHSHLLTTSQSWFIESCSPVDSPLRA